MQLAFCFVKGYFGNYTLIFAVRRWVGWQWQCGGWQLMPAWSLAVIDGSRGCTRYGSIQMDNKYHYLDIYLVTK